MGFTTTSILYSIEYELLIRAVLSGGKDLTSSQPIHICPWDREACTRSMKQIECVSSKGHRKEVHASNTFKEVNREDKRILVE